MAPSEIIVLSGVAYGIWQSYRFIYWKGYRRGLAQAPTAVQPVVSVTIPVAPKVTTIDGEPQKAPPKPRKPDLKVVPAMAKPRKPDLKVVPAMTQDQVSKALQAALNAKKPNPEEIENLVKLNNEFRQKQRA